MGAKKSNPGAEVLMSWVAVMVDNEARFRLDFWPS
jgi:hypothetical protein